MAFLLPLINVGSRSPLRSDAYLFGSGGIALVDIVEPVKDIPAGGVADWGMEGWASAFGLVEGAG